MTLHSIFMRVETFRGADGISRIRFTRSVNEGNVVRPLPHCNRYASHMPCVLMTSIHVQGREQSITASSNSNHGASERVNTHLNQLR